MNISSESQDLQFSEANESWETMPEWAKFLIMFGYKWDQQPPVNRRIALISMPCDSAAAGLIGLGAIRKYLETPGANDLSQHLQRIRSEKEKLLKHRAYPRSKFRYLGKKTINGTDRDMIKEIKTSRGRNGAPPLSMTFYPKDVHFEGEPLLEVVDSNKLPNGMIYQKLIDEGSKVLEENLQKTYSNVCLAGRNQGEKATQEIMSNIRLRSNGAATGLDQLLTVHRWIGKDKASRLVLFNTRTKKIDREVAPPSLVIGDGDVSFLEILSNEFFRQSDIIATIDRTLERERLENISIAMADYSQWYTQIKIENFDLDSIPLGISLAIWIKR